MNRQIADDEKLEHLAERDRFAELRHDRQAAGSQGRRIAAIGRAAYMVSTLSAVRCRRQGRGEWRLQRRSAPRTISARWSVRRHVRMESHRRSTIAVARGRSQPLVRLLWRAVRLRCPACGQAKIFRGWFAMHEACAACGRRYQRDAGYFLGSIYFNYGVTGDCWSSRCISPCISATC